MKTCKGVSYLFSTSQVRPGNETRITSFTGYNTLSLIYLHSNTLAHGTVTN